MGNGLLIQVKKVAPGIDPINANVVLGITSRVIVYRILAIRLSDPAHGIVTKTVHKTLPGVVGVGGGGGQGVGVRGDSGGQGDGNGGGQVVWVMGSGE